MPGDVNISFATPGADQAAQEVKRFGNSVSEAEMAWRNATQVFSRTSGPNAVPTLLDLATAAAKRNRDAQGELARATEEAGNKIGGTRKQADNAREGLNLFGLATDKLKGQFGSFSQEALKFGLTFAGIATAFQAFKSVISSASELETVHVRLRNLVGDAEQGDRLFSQLRDVSHRTATGIGEISAATADLLSTGTGVDQVSGRVESLAKVAKIAGEPLGNISELFSRIQLRGEVTFREPARLALVTGTQIRDLAVNYQRMQRSVETVNVVTEVASKVQAAAFARLQESTAAVAEFGEKVGLTDRVFQSWIKDMQQTRQFTVEGFGGTAVAGLATKSITEFRYGIAQIAHETGISQQAIAQFVRQGVYGAQELVAAYQRYLAQQEKTRELELQRSKEAATASAEAAKLNLYTQIEKKLNDVATLDKQAADSLNTFSGSVDKLGQRINEVFQNIGKPIINVLKPGLDEATKSEASLQAGMIALGAVATTVVAVQTAAAFVSVAKAVGEVTTALRGAAVAEAAFAEAEAGGGLLTMLARAGPQIALLAIVIGSLEKLYKTDRPQGYQQREALRSAQEDVRSNQENLARLRDQQQTSHNVSDAQIQQAEKALAAAKATLSLAEAADKAGQEQQKGTEITKQLTSTIQSEIEAAAKLVGATKEEADQKKKGGGGVSVTMAAGGSAGAAAGAPEEKGPHWEAQPGGGYMLVPGKGEQAATDLFKSGGFAGKSPEQIWNELGGSGSYGAMQALLGPHLTPTEEPVAPLQAEALRQGLFESTPHPGEAPKLTQLGQQRFGQGENAQVKQLGLIHEEIKGQRRDLEKVLSASQ
jgi:hypothetical protein